MPEFWTQSQLIEKTNTYSWLIVCNRKLGCKTCRNVKNIKTQQTDGINLSLAWIDVSVEATFVWSQVSWCLKNVKTPKLRLAQSSRLATAENEVMEQMSARLEKSREHSTQRIFRTAYYLAKRRRQLLTFRSSSTCRRWIEQKWGDCFRQISCAAVIVHIAAEMKRRLCEDIIKQDKKILILIDELTTVSRLSVLTSVFI